jgi:virulence-associated protein VagC
MKVKVTEQGVFIPKEFLTGVEEVDIRKQDHQIVVTPVFLDDPIFELGETPVMCHAPDASEDHDTYLYTPHT